ncbi:MAG TPA: protein kinase [Candidatus Acidoferrales bacterium]|nr:protein kinase [Candidatus Acidoferrales bacterium]
MEGDRLGHFSLLEKIGEGGMGRVYRARDTTLERLVAIKVLPESRNADADRRARFLREAKAASALNHPNIVTVHETGEEDGRMYIVMELVEGKPLKELIPRKGMRLTEALRIAAQVADALTAAHAAGIVHRDLKPGNIMVDARGRVKVLDFGLAKLAAPGDAAGRGVEVTRTMAAEPRTEEGVVLGSVPYMSPEQAEGLPVDARSDIFSFGSVLYEMVTGERAFRGESRASTLAALVEKDPRPPSEIAGGVPPELERLIARCLRKDIGRRSQHMADVKLALEELRDESESGKLARETARDPAARKRAWFWAAAGACLAITAGALAWSYASRRGALVAGPELVRLSPDDEHAYGFPDLSPDGKFAVYTSDRSGNRELWLQQVAGGDPIQLTHGPGPVLGGRFFPDGARLIYAVASADGTTSSIEVIPTLGGQPRVLGTARPIMGGDLSRDGRQVAYFESGVGGSRPRLMVLSTDGGQPRELPAWQQTQPMQSYITAAFFTSDSRYLLCTGAKRPGALDFTEWEWFALPVDGGNPRATAAGDLMRAAGLRLTIPSAVSGDRVLFGGGRQDRDNIWEARFAADSWRIRGTPRQLTFGTENQRPVSISASGVVALEVLRESTDLYLIPLSQATGQPSGVSRRLTRDRRYKYAYGVGGAPGMAYFSVQEPSGNRRNDFAVDLESGAQMPVAAGLDNQTSIIISSDGRQIAYSIAGGNVFSIRVGDAGAGQAAARTLCEGCGRPIRFSADGRYILYQPEARVRPDPKAKYTLRLMEVATGKERPWLDDPTGSVTSVGLFGADSAWVAVRLQRAGTAEPGRWYLYPWKEEPVQPPDRIEVKAPSNANFTPYGDFFQFFQGGKLTAMRFDRRSRTVSEPYELKFLPGTAEMAKPADRRLLRGPGMVFSRQEYTGSVWLMKLPR